MNEPFTFLNEEEDEKERAGVAWLPLTLAALALAGFLIIPIRGLLDSKRNTTDWSRYTPNEGMKVGFMTEGKVDPLTLDPLLTPDPTDLRDDLVSVDETLASLGSNYVETKGERIKARNGAGLSVERKASLNLSPKRSPQKRPYTLARISQKPGDWVALKKETSAKTQVRTPTIQQPTVATVSARAIKPHYDIVLQPGNTLYGISRQVNSTPEEIAKINHIDPGSPIQAGRVLRVPGYPSKPQVSFENQRPIGKQAIIPDKSPPSTRAVIRPSVPNPPRKTGMPQQPPVIVTSNMPGSSYSRPLPSATVGTRTIIPPAPRQQPRTVSGLTLEKQAQPKERDPLDKWGHAIAYRVQTFDNINRIADAHATTPDELIKINGRSAVKKGEMLVVPLDNCLIKNAY